MELIADKYVSDILVVERTWRERLFTRPWNPRQKTRWIYAPRVYKNLWEDNAVGICSYQTYDYFSRNGSLPPEAKVICVGKTSL